MNKNLSFQKNNKQIAINFLEQITLREIIKNSKKEFYDKLKEIEDDIYSISLVDKNDTVKDIRKFSNDDIVSDNKEYVKIIIRKNSDISI